MFDLTAESAESARRPLRERSVRFSVTAVLAHFIGMMAVVAVPVSRAIIVQPETSTIQAFVATPDVFPPVSTPPAAPAAAAPMSTSHSAIEPAAAPSESPIDIQPEPTGPSTAEAAGAAGGIEGGAAGGVIGGVIGGIVVPVAPPPARPLVRPAPLRTSGAIKPPDLLHRVEPVYSALAAVAHIGGVVVVEATVDVDGSIESVRLLRSASPFLERAATDALKQWRYAPLVIAGLPTRFVVTVTFNFRFPEVRGASGNDD